MPPRKKAKASAASTPLRDTQPKTPQESQSQDDVLNDPWADEQETQLYKSMMKWKPTGFHKHFRMISIHNDMRSHGFATEDAPHTRIPGIWKKLGQLYALDALDERENQYAFSDEPDPADPDDADKMPEFELPEDEFGELMWQKRFHREESAAASSPATIPTEDDKALYAPGMGLLKTRPGSARSHKAETPAEATPTPKTGKGTRSNRAATTKTGKGTRTSAKGSKAQSAASESPGDEEDEDEEEESSAASEEDSAPTTRRTNRGRTKAAPKRTRKR